MADFRGRLGLVLGASLVLCVAASLLVTRSGLRPLADVVEASGRIGPDTLAERIDSRFRRAGLDPPDIEDVLRGEPGDATARIVEWLVDEGRLTRIQDGRLFHADVLADLRTRLRARATVSRTIDVATFKELFGVTRRNAIPLLEQLDAERTTRRVGNVREILGT